MSASGIGSGSGSNFSASAGSKRLEQPVYIYAGAPPAKRLRAEGSSGATASSSAGSNASALTGTSVQSRVESATAQHFAAPEMATASASGSGSVLSATAANSSHANHLSAQAPDVGDKRLTKPTDLTPDEPTSKRPKFGGSAGATASSATATAAASSTTSKSLATSECGLFFGAYPEGRPGFAFDVQVYALCNLLQTAADKESRCKKGEAIHDLRPEGDLDVFSCQMGGSGLTSACYNLFTGIFFSTPVSDNMAVYFETCETFAELPQKVTAFLNFQVSRGIDFRIRLTTEQRDALKVQILRKRQAEKTTPKGEMSTATTLNSKDFDGEYVSQFTARYSQAYNGAITHLIRTYQELHSHLSQVEHRFPNVVVNIVTGYAFDPLSKCKHPNWLATARYFHQTQLSNSEANFARLSDAPEDSHEGRICASRLSSVNTLCFQRHFLNWLSVYPDKIGPESSEQFDEISADGLTDYTQTIMHTMLEKPEEFPLSHLGWTASEDGV